MAISFVNSSSFTTGTTVGQISTIAPGISVTLGNLLVATVFLPSGGSPVTFSASSTSTPTGWTCVKTFDNTSGGTFGFCYAICSSSIPSDLVTVSWGTLVNRPNVLWAQYLSTAGWSGVSENPAPVFTVNLANANLSGGPMTTTHANSVIIAKVEYNPSGFSSSISSGWTARATVGANLSDLFDNIETPGTYTLTATTSTTGWMCDMHALFDASGPPVQTVTFNGIPSSESIGIPNVAATGTVNRSAGIASSEVFGILTVLAPANISLTGILSGQSFGSVSVQAPAAVTLSGIPPSESFHAPVVSSSFSPILFVQTNSHFTGINPSGSCSFLSPITLGNFIVVVMMTGGAITITSVTDTSGNVYQSAITDSDAITTATTAVYYSPITTGGGTTPTVTAAFSVSHSSGLFVYEFSGINLAFPIDSVGVASPHGSSGTNISSTSMAMTSNPNDLIIGGAFAFPSGPITSPEPGWNYQTLASSAFLSEYIIVSNRESHAATCTQSVSTPYVAAVASFQSVALGPPAMMALVY